TPASDLPIVSPDLLDDTSIKAVLVMAGSYSDEIVRLIRRRRENTVAVAVLQDANLEILP
ncbi:MAG: methyltransferase, partial [Lentisphaeria bacterium]|nr:methyltransferase [Lentisphaeria bacterium]